MIFGLQVRIELQVPSLPSGVQQVRSVKRKVPLGKARMGLTNSSKTGLEIDSDADGIHDISSSLSIDRPFKPPLKSSAEKRENQNIIVWFYRTKKTEHVNRNFSTGYLLF